MSKITIILALIGAIFGVNRPKQIEYPPFVPTIVVTNIFHAKIGNAIYSIRSQRYIKVSENPELWQREFNTTNLFIPDSESFIYSNRPPNFVLAQ